MWLLERPCAQEHAQTACPWQKQVSPAFQLAEQRVAAGEEDLEKESAVVKDYYAENGQETQQDQDWDQDYQPEAGAQLVLLVVLEAQQARVALQDPPPQLEAAGQLVSRVDGGSRRCCWKAKARTSLEWAGGRGMKGRWTSS